MCASWVKWAEEAELEAHVPHPWRNQAKEKDFELQGAVSCGQ